MRIREALAYTFVFYSLSEISSAGQRLSRDKSEFWMLRVDRRVRKGASLAQSLCYNCCSSGALSWRVRLGVRTRGSQPCNTGSIPVPATIQFRLQRIFIESPALPLDRRSPGSGACRFSESRQWHAPPSSGSPSDRSSRTSRSVIASLLIGRISGQAIKGSQPHSSWIESNAPWHNSTNTTFFKNQYFRGGTLYCSEVNTRLSLDYAWFL